MTVTRFSPTAFNTNGETDWPSAGNALADDGVYAGGSLTKNATYGGIASGFDFASVIPVSGYQINSVTFGVNVGTNSSNNNLVAGNSVELFKNGVSSGTPIGPTVAWTADADNSSAGGTWSVAELRANNATVKARYRPSSNGPTVELDHVWVEVNWEEAVPQTYAVTGTIAATSAVSGAVTVESISLERKAEVGGTYAEVHRGDDDGTHTDPAAGLSSGTTYYYRARRYDGTNYSSYSNEESVAYSTGGTTYPVTGTIAATSGASGAVTAELVAAGTIAATSGATGTVTATFGASGTIASTSGASGSATVVGGATTYPVTGTVAIVSGASGTIHIRAPCTGTIVSTSGVSGDATILGAWAEGDTVALEWTESTDPDLAGPITYEGEFSALGTFADAVSIFSGVSGLTYNWTLAYTLVTTDTNTCRIRIRARDFDNELSTWDVSEAFTVRNVAADFSASGTIAATSGVSGAVTAELLTTGTVEATSGASGSVTATFQATGTAAAESTVSGSLSAILTASGTIEAVSGASGAATIATGIQEASGTITATSGVSGAVTATIGVAGTVVAESGISGSVFVEYPVSGTIAAESGATGSVTAELPTSGSIASTSDTTGTVTALLAASGTIAAVSGVSGSANLPNSSASGTIAAVSGVSGNAAIWLRAGEVLTTRIVSVRALSSPRSQTTTQSVSVRILTSSGSGRNL